MKKVISILTILLIMFLCLGCLTGCEDKNKENGDNTDSTVSDYKWPNLTDHNIPNFEKGKITSLTESEGKDGYVFDYEIELSSVTKQDLDDFAKSFEGWFITEHDNTTYIVKSDRVYSYTVAIDFNEEKGTAKIIMTAMQ